MASLDLELTEPQQMLVDAVQRLLADVEQPDWQALTAQLGLGALTLPEAAGGFGGGAAEVALVMAELGPALAGADWLSHAAACGLPSLEVRTRQNMRLAKWAWVVQILEPFST